MFHSFLHFFFLFQRITIAVEKVSRIRGGQRPGAGSQLDLGPLNVLDLGPFNVLDLGTFNVQDLRPFNVLNLRPFNVLDLEVAARDQGGSKLTRSRTIQCFRSRTIQRSRSRNIQRSRSRSSCQGPGGQQAN